MPSRSCTFVIPGDWLTPTGGYRYDRKIVLALRDAGWSVELLSLGEGFPFPDDRVKAEAERALAALAESANAGDKLVVVDGLAFAVLPEPVERHAANLAFVALVHHPLHLETGLSPSSRDSLLASERRALARARLVIVTSRSTMEDVLAMGVNPDLIVVVEPGTDLPSTLPERRPGSIASAVRLLCVATLVPRKGHAVLLQALAGLTHLDWTLDCVGSRTRDPSTSAGLQTLADDAGLSGRVRWLGEKSDSELVDFYAAADVFVLPSFHEGYGMVITEALAHGLPIVTTTGGALAHTLPDGAGIHVPPGDVDALQQALKAMILDVDLRRACAQGARAAARSLPTWPQAAERFASMLDRVLS